MKEIGAADQTRTGPKSLEGSCATTTPQPRAGVLNSLKRNGKISTSTPIVGNMAGFPYQFANSPAGMMRNEMPVTKPNMGRVVAAPARCKRYNIPDSELKGLGLRVERPRQDGGGHRAWCVQAMGFCAVLISFTVYASYILMASRAGVFFANRAALGKVIGCVYLTVVGALLLI